MGSKFMVFGSIGLAGLGVSMADGRDPVWVLLGLVFIGIAVFMGYQGEEMVAKEEHARIERAKR